MKIVDSHIHLIDVTGHDWYPGLKAWADGLDFPGLYSDFLLADYRAGEDRPVDAFVHVSATTSRRGYLDETRWVDRLADEHDIEMAIVATVDPTLEPAQMVADLDEQAAATARLRGLRVLSDSFEPGSAAADTVLGWLEQHGLVFDLVTHPDSMQSWLRSLERFPGLRVVLEHTGWPTGTDAESRQTWEQAMQAFATSTDAPCKLSGLGMTTLDTSQAALRPWLEFAIEQLGWDRVMFGSNLPIETMGGSHRQLLETLTAIVAQADASDRAKFWGGNAELAYWGP